MNVDWGLLCFVAIAFLVVTLYAHDAGRTAAWREMGEGQDRRKAERRKSRP